MLSNLILLDQTPGSKTFKLDFYTGTKLFLLSEWKNSYYGDALYAHAAAITLKSGI